MIRIYFIVILLYGQYLSQTITVHRTVLLGNVTPICASYGVDCSGLNRGGLRPSQHSQLRMSDFLASRFSKLTNLSTQIESDFSRLLTPVPIDICCTLGIPLRSGNLAIVIK